MRSTGARWSEAESSAHCGCAGREAAAYSRVMHRIKAAGGPEVSRIVRSTGARWSEAESSAHCGCVGREAAAYSRVMLA